MTSYLTLDPAVHFSLWLADSTIRRYLIHFTQTKWSQVAKYTLLLGLGHLEFHGLDPYKLTPSSLELHGKKSFSDVHNIVTLEDGNDEEVSYCVRRKAVGFTVLFPQFKKENIITYSNQKKAMRSIKLQHRLRKPRRLRCETNFPTDWAMFLVFRRFFSQFPETVWPRFLKYLFYLGLNYLIFLGAQLQLLSVEFLRDLVFEFGCALPGDSHARESGRNKLRSMKIGSNLSQLTPYQGIVEKRTQTGRCPTHKKKEPRLKSIQKLFPIQFVSPTWEKKHRNKDSIRSVDQEWWYDSPALFEATRCSEEYLNPNQYITLEAFEVVRLLKVQEKEAQRWEEKNRKKREQEKHQRLQKLRNSSFLESQRKRKLVWRMVNDMSAFSNDLSPMESAVRKKANFKRNQAIRHTSKARILQPMLPVQEQYTTKPFNTQLATRNKGVPQWSTMKDGQISQTSKQRCCVLSLNMIGKKPTLFFNSINDTTVCLDLSNQKVKHKLKDGAHKFSGILRDEYQMMRETSRHWTQSTKIECPLQVLVSVQNNKKELEEKKKLNSLTMVSDTRADALERWKQTFKNYRFPLMKAHEGSKTVSFRTLNAKQQRTRDSLPNKLLKNTKCFSRISCSRRHSPSKPLNLRCYVTKDFENIIEYAETTKLLNEYL